MELTRKEIEELTIIEKYLEHSNSEIVTLGYSLYKSKYERKFKDRIRGIYIYKSIYNPNCPRYRCEYISNYWSKYHNCYLSYAIHNIIYYDYGFD